MLEITNITANFVSASTNNPMSTISFNTILEKFRKESFSERDKGFRFEKLMQAYLKTTPLYSNLFGKIFDVFHADGNSSSILKIEQFL